MMTTQLDAARQAAASYWKLAPEKVYPLDISSRFPWAHKTAFFLVQDPDRRGLLVAVGPGDASVVFHDPKDLSPMNKVFQAEGATLPGTMSAEQLAWTVRNILGGPGGFVGSREFWAKEKDALRSWVPAAAGDGKALFQKYCEDPRLEKHGGEWTLHFYYFNNMGGVEEWQVSGELHAVKSATFNAAVKNRTFSFPYG
jgi:hypothetical protein